MKAAPTVVGRSIVLAIAATGGALLAATLAATLLLYQNMAKAGAGLAGRPMIETILLASALVIAGALLLPAAFYSLRSLGGAEPAEAIPPALGFWEGCLLMLGWALAIAGAQAFYSNSRLNSLTPLCFGLAVCLPAYFLLRLASGGLAAGSRQRTWGAMATGILVGSPLAILIEGALAVAALIGLVAYAALDPAFAALLQSLRRQLEQASTTQAMLDVLSPYLMQPLAVLGALFVLSGLAPLVEETVKSIAVWTIFDRLSSAAQGFAAGALAGAGFGILESLLASAQPDANWAETLLVRGGSTMMHICTASLTGWGVGMFRIDKRPRRLLGMYALAMGLHALWNACVVLIVVGGVQLHAPGASNAAGTWISLAGETLLGLMALGLPVGLRLANLRLRPAAESAVSVSSSGPT